MRPPILFRLVSLLVLSVVPFTTAISHASIALVVGEPFGSFGTMMPVGHAAIYLDHICVAGPTELRHCQRGELGSVISRYHDLRSTHLDWIAVPASIFFYGVEDPSHAPQWITPTLEASIRAQYRHAHLLAVAPDRLKHGRLASPPYGDWQEAIGAAYDRRLFLYAFDTTPAQNELLLTQLNTSPNVRSYSLRRANCADFAASLLALVVPPALHRNALADFDLTSPKNLARIADAYGQGHPELNFRVYQVPQIPGTLRRSRPLRGGAEGIVKTKRYLFTVLFLQPELLLTDWVFYEARGRWTIGRKPQPISPDQWYGSPQTAGYSPASTSSSTASEGMGFLAK